MERITKALSVRQPWAHAIMQEGKAIENRSWQTKLRGPIAIHAGRLADEEEFFAFIGSGPLRDSVCLQREEAGRLPRGAVVGVVDLVDCVRDSSSPWFEGPFGFVLANPRPLKPITCAGAMQFFELPPQVVDNIAAQLNG